MAGERNAPSRSSVSTKSSSTRAMSAGSRRSPRRCSRPKRVTWSRCAPRPASKRSRSSKSLTFEVSQQPVDELGRVAQERYFVRQLFLELPQRLDKRTTLGEGLLDQRRRLLLAHLL